MSEVHPSFTHTSPLIAAISNCSFPFQIPSCFLPPWEVYSLSTLKCLWDKDQRVPSEGWWRQADCTYYKAALAPRQIFHQFPISKSTFWPKGWNTSLSCFHFPKVLLFVGCVVSSLFHRHFYPFCVASHTSRFAGRGIQLNEYNIHVKIFHGETSFQGMTQQSIFVSSD